MWEIHKLELDDDVYNDIILQYSILLEMELDERNLTIVDSDTIDEAIKILKMSHSYFYKKTRNKIKNKKKEIDFNYLNSIGNLTSGLLALIALPFMFLNFTHNFSLIIVIFSVLLSATYFFLYSIRNKVEKPNKFALAGTIIWLFLAILNSISI